MKIDSGVLLNDEKTVQVCCMLNHTCGPKPSRFIRTTPSTEYTNKTDILSWIQTEFREKKQHGFL